MVVVCEVKSVAECRSVSKSCLFVELLPLTKHRDNDYTQSCDFDSDSPALTYQSALFFAPEVSCELLRSLLLRFAVTKFDTAYFLSAVTAEQ